MSAGPTGVLLDVAGLTKTFGVVKALQQVDLSVRAGSVHAVVGHNGAGKSTLMNLLSGVYRPDAGVIMLGGKDVHFTAPRDALEEGISMVHQELSIIPDLDVGENLFLGREPVARLGFVDRGKMYRQTCRVLEELNLGISPRERCATLSVGARQMIEIAQAVSRRAKVLILDEPTSALSETEQERLYEFIAQLQRRAIGILYVSHKLDEVRMLSDTVTVLRDGKRVTTLPTAELDHDSMVELMVGHVITKSPSARPPHSAVGLEVSNLSARASRIEGATFSARQGEIVGLAGMLGSGRTELFELLFGLRPHDSGTIVVRGKPFRPGSPLDAMGAKVALVPEDRRSQGIFGELPIWKNIAFSALDIFRGRLATVREGDARRAAEVEVARFRIATPGINQPIQLLSGGNQQKVILARWLLRQPDVLLLDDPTAGIDVGAKDEIHAFIRELAEKGLTVIMSSSEFPELLDVCHRILVIRRGRIVGEMDPRTSTEAEIVRLATAGEATPQELAA